MTPSSLAHPPTARYGSSTRGRHAVAVLDATLAELEDRGYAAASLRTIAARAGVPLEAVFSRWRSKQHLVLDALRRSARRQPTPETGDLRTDLRQVTVALADVLAHPGAAEVLRSLLAAPGAGDGQDASSARLLAERRSVIRRIVERGQRRQQLSSSIHPGLVADALVGALVYRVLVSGDQVTPQTAGRLVDVVVGTDHTA